MENKCTALDANVQEAKVELENKCKALETTEDLIKEVKSIFVTLATQKL